MTTPDLVGMPLELLVHLIATYLPTKDLGALRLTSKHFETALFDTFAKEFFDKKQFMLTTPSLDALVKISKHAALSKVVKHVIIGLENYEQSPPISHYRDPDQTKHEKYCNGLADQLNLLGSGRACIMLAEAFRNLPHLTTLGIRDYNAYGRSRDDTKWRSYGVGTVFEETGVELQGSSSEYATQVYTILMQALATSDTSIPSILVFLRKPQIGLTNIAFLVRSTDPQLKPVLDGLRQLLLTLNPEVDRNPQHRMPFLDSFLLRTRFLTHLRLNFLYHNGEQDDILLRLSRANNLLPNLERLDLGMVVTSPYLLVQTFNKFSSTLRQISLWKVCLGLESDPCWKDSQDRFNPWPEVLRMFSSNLYLTSMMLGRIQQCHSSFERESFRICVQVNGSISHSQDYSGEMDLWLPRAIEQLSVEFPEDPDRSSGSDQSEEDSDADDDENDDVESEEGWDEELHAEMVYNTMHDVLHEHMMDHEESGDDSA